MPWRYALTVLPEDDRLSPEELFFLSKVAPMGLDWRTTREEFRQRIGVTRYCDWEVIALPPSTALTDSPLEFRMYAREGTMDLPPEYLSADFMPYDDARKNHLSIERELVATLGSPIVNDAANCLGRRWSFGVFAIELHTFPPELQDAYLRRNNTRFKHNPRLAIASGVSLHSAYAWVYPDAHLRRVADLVCAARSSASGVPVLFIDSRGLWRTTFLPLRATRRNPGILNSVLGSEEQVAWRDDDGGTFGVSRARESLLFRTKPSSCLILSRVEPLRGPGGSELWVQTDEPRDPRSPFEDRTVVLRGEKMDSLDTVAERLSRLWNLDVQYHVGSDD